MPPSCQVKRAPASAHSAASPHLQSADTTEPIDADDNSLLVEARASVGPTAHFAIVQPVMAKLKEYLKEHVYFEAAPAGVGV